MPDALPPDIQNITTTRGTLYEMPARTVGRLRYVAMAAVLIGLLLSCTAIYILLVRTGLLGWLTDGQYGAGNMIKPFEVFCAVPMVLIGIGLLRLGRFLMGGRSSIELRDGSLITTQTLGLIRRRKTYAINDIKKFQVKSMRSGEGDEAPDTVMSALNVVVADDKMRNVTWGYSKATLLALAEHLTEACESSGGTAVSGDQREPITIEERTIGDGFDEPKIDDEALEDEAIPLRPEDAASTLELRDDGLTITIPPVGIRKGSKGLFGFSIFWNLFMVVFTGFWIVGSKGSTQGASLLMLVAFFGLFWAIGLSILVVSINAGRRRAILDVVGDTLLITRQNIFKTHQQEVHRDNIKSIRRDASGTKVNDVPLLNLQVHLVKGKKIAMLGQLSNDELAWIAAELHKP